MVRSVAIIWFCLTATGCAALAKKPPTPAAEISPRESTSVIAPPGERYYILIFGSQSTPKQARFTHTWASMVRVAGSTSPGEQIIDEKTISWMPASLKIRSLSRHPEKGVNLGLQFTIDEMLRNDERISVWGPYEVSAGFHRRFLIQKQFMESGQIGYQCIDTWGEAARHGSGCDCIHAITDMDPQFSRSRYPLAYFGEAASKNIVRQLHERPIIIGPKNDHSWLFQPLGLTCHPLIQRKYCGTYIENTPENVENYLSKHDS